jgi:hypothetical protein
MRRVLRGVVLAGLALLLIVALAAVAALIQH